MEKHDGNGAKAADGKAAERRRAVVRGAAFLLAFLLAFCLMDLGLSRVCPGLFMAGGYSLNDYEITVRDHGGSSSWDKAFFGSSNVINDYREDASSSGYVNAGIAYGTVADLRDMLQGGYVEIGSDLVLGVSYLTFYDGLDTNPTYPWKRAPFEPYCYFERDRLSQAAESFAAGLAGVSLEREPAVTEKFTVTGRMSDEELQAAVGRHEELYWNQPIGRFRSNLDALQDVADFCAEHGVRLRAVWMPWNPQVPRPQIARDVEAAANEIFERNGVEVLDLSDGFGAECFYDVGHLNTDVGAYDFTEAIDPWLNS